MNAAEEKYLLSLIPEEGITAPELGLLISPSSDPNVRRAKAWRKLRQLSDRGLVKKTFDNMNTPVHRWKKVVQ